MAKSRYADESLFEGMHEDAKAYTEKAGGDRATTPLMFLDEGTYTMRVWPDIFTSPESGKKKLRAARVMNSHNLPRDMGGRVPCEGANCRVCAQVKKLEDAKYGKAWQFKAKEEGIIIGYIFKSNADESKYLKIKEAAYIVLSPRVFIAFQQFIAGLDREDLIQVMNPEIEAKGLKLSFTSGNKGSASWGFDLRDYELPELPIDFDDFPISRVYFDENDPSKSYITDDNLAALRKFVAGTIATRSTSFDPDKDGDQSDRRRGGDREEGRERADRGAERESRREPAERSTRSRSSERDEADRGAERGTRGRSRESEQEPEPERETGSSRTTTSRSSRDADDADRGRGRADRAESAERTESSRSSRGSDDGDHDRRSRGHGADPEDRAERQSGREPNAPTERASRARSAEREAPAARRESSKDRDAGDDKGGRSGRTIPIIECPSDDKLLKFGENPEILDGEMHPDCITCAHEAECQKEAEATKQAKLDKELGDIPH